MVADASPSVLSETVALTEYVWFVEPELEYVWVAVSVAAPLELAVPVTCDVTLSPQLIVPPNESVAAVAQEIVAVTCWFDNTGFGKTELRLQLGVTSTSPETLRIRLLSESAMSR
jgi:hypothetical protein